MLSLMKLVALVAIVWLGSRYVRKVLGALFPAPRRDVFEGHGPEDAVYQGEMVRDPVCNTFLVKERSLTVRKDGQTLYFCSEACRLKFLGGSDGKAHE